MARTPLLNTSTDAQTDSGGILWSLVCGEQLEFPVTLSFIENVGVGYTYEAVAIEGANIANSGAIPDTVRAGGVQQTLVVRVPTDRGVWNGATAYNREDVVSYSTKYYKLASGTSRVSATLPNVDPLWVEYTPNKVYIQFPSTLSVSAAWSVGPTPTAAVYGFFELRVTEPTGGVYQRTWKPMRGLIEILFSPTELI